MRESRISSGHSRREPPSFSKAHLAALDVVVALLVVVVVVIEAVSLLVIVVVVLAVEARVLLDREVTRETSAEAKPDE